jgi:hypothetical protein
MVSIKWGEGVNKAFRFSIDPRRWLPFFILDIGFFGAVILYALSNLSMLENAVATIGRDPTAIGQLLGAGLVFFVMFIIYFLLKLWLTGATIHQSVKEKEISKSYRISCSRYLSLLGVAVISALIGIGASMVPAFSSILSIIIGLILFFPMQEVMVNKKGTIDAISNSWNIFKKEPAKVFLMWLLLSLVGGVILVILALPLLITALSILVPYLAATNEVAAFSAILAYVILNINTFLILGAIAVVGTSISTVFLLKGTTEYYMQMKKKFKII